MIDDCFTSLFTCEIIGYFSSGQDDITYDGFPFIAQYT